MGLAIGDFIQRVITSVKEYGVTTESRVIVREGDFGPEREIEHVKARQGRWGTEIVIQTNVRPLDG